MQDIVITLLQKMFILTLQISVPVLLIGVVIGLMVSIFQTVTQIQESTLTFVPKIVGCVVLLIFLLLILCYQIWILFCFSHSHLLSINTI